MCENLAVRLRVRDGWGPDQPLTFPGDAEPVGYAWMVRQRGLDVMPHFRWSFTAPVSKRQIVEDPLLVWELFPRSYRPESMPGQLEFALKYDGVNLEILTAWFELLDVQELETLEAWVRRAPTSAYVRRAWYLYEWLTGRVLGVPDARSGPYVGVLDAAAYYTATEHRSQRHRVANNLLGGREFCPMVRRTAAVAHFAGRALGEQIANVLGQHDPDTLARVMTYLYTKETRSSYEIEREKPSADRVKHFVGALRHAHAWPHLDRSDLVALQNLIVVDPRSRANAYRTEQNYVGGPGPRDVAMVAPRPEDLAPLMAGWLNTVGRLIGSDVDPVVAAAAVAFSFVYLHPFEDGNGRIHRFLIHYVLAQKRFTPEAALIPVSAVMLARPSEYDLALERFSVPLMARLRYDIDGDGRVEVLHDSSGYYRYPDLTAQAEALYGWLARSIEEDVPKELSFILAYRAARLDVNARLELPDRVADPFVLRVMEQGGRLSKNRRNREFAQLTDAEAADLESIVREAMRQHGMEVKP